MDLFNLMQEHRIALPALLAHTNMEMYAKPALLVKNQMPEHRVALHALLVKLTLQEAKRAKTALLVKNQ